MSFSSLRLIYFYLKRKRPTKASLSTLQGQCQGFPQGVLQVVLLTKNFLANKTTSSVRSRRGQPDAYDHPTPGFCCTTAVPSAAGLQNRFTRQFVTTFRLSPKAYGFNQLRYDLRKLKGHALLQRDGRRYAYRLTAKGVEVALLFLFFHKRLCGPLANSRFHHKPDPANRPNSQLEAAYHKADKAIENIVNLLHAA